jgi:tetratricopeptide (TPR) repeat protein
VRGETDRVLRYTIEMPNRGVWLVALLLAPMLHADNLLVLRFFNLSKDSSLNWIGDSIAESIRETLAAEGRAAIERDEREEVYQRLAIRPYAMLTKASVVKLGEALDAEQVIYGQFEIKPATDLAVKSRGSVQITAHLLDLKHIKQGPDFGEVGALEDLAALQRHLAWQTLRFVSPEDQTSEEEFVRRHPAVRVDAIENYIRGLLARREEDKHRFFTQAVRLDASFSQPCFQLGRLHLQRSEYKLAADWLQKVSLDDVHYREASFLLGLCRYYLGDFVAAQAAFESVAKIVPLNEVYNNLGAAESRRNEPQALESFQKALEGDERDPAYHFNVGYCLWKHGKFEAAAERFRAVLARNPEDADAKLLLARCEKQSGPRSGDTRTEALERLKTNYEESAWWQLKAALQPQKP